MCADQAKCVDVHFCCEANHFPDCAEGSEEKTATLQVRLRVLWCVRAGIVECLKGWRFMVGGVWKVWRCVGWWEEWCVGRSEVCGWGGVDVSGGRVRCGWGR